MTNSSAFRLVVMDVDGTLVDDHNQIPPENCEALAAARKRGVGIAIASGRNVPSIESVEERLGLDCALIAYNGGKIVGPRSRGRPCISHRPVPEGLMAQLLDYSRQSGLLLNVYLDEKIYADVSQKTNPLADLYSRRTGSGYHFTYLERLRESRPTKVSLLAEPDERNRLYEEFRKKLEGQVHVLRTAPEYLEFLALGVDKGTALPDLADYYGVPLDEVLAIGDGFNDREMIEVAGMGVAVAGSPEEVRRAAKWTTSRACSEGAVAEAIERWVLGES